MITIDFGYVISFALAFYAFLQVLVWSHIKDFWHERKNYKTDWDFTVKMFRVAFRPTSWVLLKLMRLLGAVK